MGNELFVSSWDLSPFIKEISRKSPIGNFEDNFENVWIFGESPALFGDLNTMFKLRYDPVVYYNGIVFRGTKRYEDAYRIVIGDTDRKTRFCLVSIIRFNTILMRMRGDKWRSHIFTSGR